MSLLLNSEQQMLREAAADFLSARAPVAAQRRLRDAGDPLRFDPQLWQEVVALGWTAAPWPEAMGGLGAGWKSLGAVFEQMGRHLSALPLLSSVVLCGTLLAEQADAAPSSPWIPSVMDGTRRLALALDESPRHAPQRIQAQAWMEGDGWVLDADKRDVIDAVGAAGLIVVARAGDEPHLFLVPSDSAGLQVTPWVRMDSRNAANVRCRGVRLGAEAHLGGGSKAAAALELALDRARMCICAETLGLARAAFEMTMAYLKERVQFDVPIGSFQALQHRAARLYVALELLDSSVAAGFEALDDKPADVPALSSLAKARAADLGEQLLNEAVQLHGGIGVTDEFDLGLFLKRARVLGQTFGDAVFHRDRYARLHGF